MERVLPFARVLEKLISGGQTGVDRAALDVALSVGLPCGGWCPRGRRAEDGVIPARYPLRETLDEDPACRTEWNVREADGTLILGRGPWQGGTALTVERARQQGKPLHWIDLESPSGVEETARWLEQHQIRVLNVAGPRESEQPGIYAQALTYLQRLFAFSKTSSAAIPCEKNGVNEGNYPDHNPELPGVPATGTGDPPTTAITAALARRFAMAAGVERGG